MRGIDERVSARDQAIELGNELRIVASAARKGQICGAAPVERAQFDGADFAQAREAAARGRRDCGFQALPIRRSPLLLTSSLR